MSDDKNDNKPNTTVGHATVAPTEEPLKKAQNKLAMKARKETLQAEFNALKTRINGLLRKTTSASYFEGDETKELVRMVTHEAHHCGSLLGSLVQIANVNSCPGMDAEPMVVMPMGTLISAVGRGEGEPGGSTN